MALFVSALIALLAPQAQESGASPEGAREDPEDWPSGSLAAGPWTARGPEAQRRYPSRNSRDFSGQAALREGDPEPRESWREIDSLRTIPPDPGGWIAQDPSQAPPGGAPGAQSAPLTSHGSFEGFFESHGSSDAWRDDVWKDYLATPHVLLPLGLAVSAAVISHWDRPLTKEWEGVLGGHQRLGNIGVYTLLGAVALVGTIFPGENRNSWDEGWTIGESLVVSTVVSTGLKYAAGRLRPNYGTDSFPSGHATYAFMSSTLLERNSGPLVGIPAYALATFTGFERVEAGRHYPSDVLAGAAIGAFTAGVIDALHWGSGARGEGISGQPIAVRVETEGLHSFQLAVELRY